MLHKLILRLYPGMQRANLGSKSLSDTCYFLLPFNIIHYISTDGWHRTNRINNNKSIKLLKRKHSNISIIAAYVAGKIPPTKHYIVVHDLLPAWCDMFVLPHENNL